MQDDVIKDVTIQAACILGTTGPPGEGSNPDNRSDRHKTLSRQPYPLVALLRQGGYRVDAVELAGLAVDAEPAAEPRQRPSRAESRQIPVAGRRRSYWLGILRGGYRFGRRVQAQKVANLGLSHIEVKEVGS